MKKRSRLSRALSILLAMLMILSNSAITTYADIIGGVSQQSAGTFTYDDNEKTVTATPQGNDVLPSGAQLVVESLDISEEDKTLIENKAKSEDNRKHATDYVGYNIYFIKDSQEIQPNGNVVVTITYKNGLDMKKVPGPGVEVYHITGGTATRVTEGYPTLSSDEKVNVVSFRTNSFSPFVVTKIGNYNFNLKYNSQKDAFTTDASYSKYYNSNSPLGVAGSFHMVGFGTVTLGAHTNGNVLANHLNAGSNFGTNNYTDELSYILHYDNVSSTSASNENHLLVLGSENKIGAEDNGNAPSVNGKKIDKPKNIVVDTDSTNTPFIDLDAVKNDMQTRSSTWSNVSNVGVSVDIKSGNSSITLLQPDGAGYYNMKASDLNNVGTAYEIAMKGFQKGHNGSIIVNVDCSGVDTVNMPKAFIYIDGQQQSTNEVTEFSAGKVIWNFINANGVTINTNLMSGMVVALGATVNAPQNLNGTIVAENIHNTGETHRTDFTGTTVPAQATFGGVKTVDGKAPNANQKFTFKLDELVKDASGNNVWSTIDTVQNSGTSIGFSDISYTTEGTHWYRIYEDQTAVAGYKLTTSQYIMKVVVTRSQTSSGNTKFDKNITYYKVNGSDTNIIDPDTLIDGSAVNESLLETKTSSSDFIFDNKEQKAEAEFKVVKTYEHDADAKFNFKLTATGANAENTPMPATTEIQASQNSGGTFGKISYTAAGEYTYEISEIAGSENEIAYDSKVYEVKVTVDDNFKVKVEYKVKDDAASTWTESTNGFTASFTNTYIEQKSSLKITKAAGANTDLSGKTFYFKVTGPNNYSTVETLNYSENTSITISDLTPGDYTVTEVTDSKGTTEVKGNQSFPYQVSGDGKITVEAGQTSEISVTNTSVLGKIKVTKQVTGKENSKDKFYVALFKADKKTKVDNQPVKEIAVGQPVTFENLVPGTYYVFETDEDGNKLNDTVVNGYIIPKDGTETTIINDQKSTVPEVEVTLTNKWLETSLSLVGGKTLTNITEDQAQKANFTFSVYKKGTNSDPVATGSYKAGKIEFTSISYNLKDLGGSSEKVFEYEIKEDIPSDAVNSVKNQIHYDTKIIPAAVTVALSSEELKITKVEVNGKEITSSNGVYDFSSAATFENYIANGTDAVVSVTKQINNGNVTSSDKKFHFTLNKADNETNSGYTDSKFNTPFTSSSVEITGIGSVDFAKIYFNKAGDYHYTLTENDLEANEYEGYQKDSSIYDVTIHVTENDNKQLIANVSYQKNGKNSNGAVFNNTYTDTEAEIEFTAKKVLPERNLKNKEFEFEIKDADGKVVSEGSNDVTGKITFNNKLQITLGQMQGGEEKGNIITKDFTYTVSEKDGKDTAIKYDTPKSITVHASYDKSTGKLSLSLDDDAKDVIFTNHYDTKAEIAFTAKKVLPERNLEDKEFKFEVKDADDKVVSEGSNDVTGKITFNNKLQITLGQMQGGEEKGNIVTKDFAYTVSEKEGNDTSIDYDLSEKSITVHASYNKTTGELTLSLDDNAKNLTFTNHYNTSESIGFNATKKLTGRKLADGEFTFTLARKDGTQKVTAVNDAEGNISFRNDAIKVTLADMQDENADGGYAAEKTFTYLLTEQPGAEGTGLTYDTTPKTVKVKATYNKTTGELALALDKDSENITITNKYTDSDSVALNGVKYLEGRSLKDGEFTFIVTDEDGKEVTTGTNNAAGQITFKDNLKYDLEDLSDGKGGYLKEKTYTYTVKENPGTEEAVTYDSTVKTVEVKVTHDAESGKVTAELTDKSEALTFKNSYVTNASIELNGTKTLTGRTQKAGEFQFEVKDSTGTTVATGTNDAEGNITFDKAIQITLADMKDGEGYAESRDFIYTVKETTGKAEGVTYDREEKTVKVHAAYDLAKGKLTLSLAEDSQPIEFTNSYNTSASINLGGTKTLLGRDAKGEEFHFEVRDSAGKLVTTGTDDVDGNITFEDAIQISLEDMKDGDDYAASKEFIYKVTEIDEGVEGIDYDTSEKVVKILAAYNKETGELTLNLADDSQPIEFTNRYDTSASIGFNATKKLTGRKLVNGEFTFTLAREDGTQKEVTAVNDAEGNISFGNEAIKVTLADMQDENADGGYAAEKTFTYLLTEQPGAEGTGLTYDTTPKTVKVKATYNKTTGELALALDKDSENITITNKYTDSDSVALNGVKYLEGRSLKDGEFTFIVTDEDGKEVTTGTNNAAGQITFKDNLKYDLEDLSDGKGGYLKEKTYTYTVKENPGTEEAVTYDSTVKTVEVKVTHDAESGKVTAELTDKSEALIFTNRYDTSASIELNGTKTLTGRTQKAGEFQFEVKDSAGTTVATGTNDATGNITFDKAIQISLADMKEGGGYAESRDFIYTVKEITGKAEGVTYDSEEKTVKIHAAYNLAEGKLTLSLADDSQPIEFTNSYDTKAEIGITANKVLPERSLKAGEFNFEIKDSAGTTAAEGSNDAVGQITFDKNLQITLSQMKGGKKDGDIITKDFTYTVSEKDGKDTSISYDLSEKSITVHASYNKTTGELTLSLDDNAKNITFTNHYDTRASIGFNATKKLTGRKLANGEFTFTLAREDGTQKEVTAVNDADGNISFGKDAIKVTLADMQDENADGGYAAEKTFTYLLTEQPGAEGTGLTYDTTPKTVKVKATYNKTTGELALALDKDSENITITNKYTDSDSVALNGVKYLEGRSLKDGEFTFIVTDEDGKEVTTGTNNAAGQITFKDNLKYDLEDLSDGKGGYLKEKTYTYTVKENPGTEEAVTYDSTVKTVEVKVTHDAESGKVTAELTDKSEALTFKNSYDTSASIELNGTKNLTGRTQKAGEFQFEVKDSEGNPVAAGTNDAEGNITFDKAIQISLADMKDGEGYAESRDFIYTVKETTGKAEGVTYDSEEKTVKIHAAYNLAEGKLTLSIADDSQPIEFTNSYHAAGQLVINGIKYVNGEELNAAQKKVLAGNVEFKLERAEVTDGQTGEFKEIQTAALTEEGTFSFKTQNYTEKNAGKTYVYQISESKADAAGFDIDSTVYTYTVSVGDNGDGTLNITALDGDGKHVTSPVTVTFNNEYHATGQAQLSGIKTLLGSRSGDIKEGEFTFQVLDEEGNEVTTGKTLAADETGKAQITFEPISYTEKDAGKTYTYTVKETAGEDKNITYDTATYQVTVKVSDNLDGTLETEVTYPEGFENGLTFINSYKAAGAATLKTTKTLEGRTAALAANEFVFSLYEVAADGTKTPVLDKDGNPMRAFNDAEGNVTFGEISYTQDDQGTHNYEIVEEAGNDSAVTYDKEPVKATVTVSDKDGSGVLDAEAAYEKDGHTSFRNEYHANGKITFTGLKKLTGNRAAEVKEGEFTFTVKDDATGETVATGKTKDGGVIEFTEISYTEKDKGEHTYTITEDKGSDSSITYSEESVKVTVNVTDSNNGGLEATPTYPEGGATFTNAYNAKGEVVLNASKTLERSTLAADQFSFELKDEQGNVLQTKKNDADGKVTFDSLKYTEADIDKTYTYTVSEVDNKITGVTYDTDVYTVKVQIIDSKDSDGTLNVTATAEKDGEAVEEMTFANTFAGTVKLVKTSTEGRTLPGAEFALYAKNDKGDYDLYTADNAKGLYTTDAKGQINVENLPANDYYFIETAAPDGYKIKKADDGSDQKYTFKIGVEDGDAGVVENAKVNAELTVQNDINGTNSITVTKKITYIDPDTFDEFEMTWPKDQTFYVNLFTDPEGTIPYRTSTPKAFTVSENSSGTATFENVSKGTYYVFETDAEGNSIPMDEMMVDDAGKQYSATVDGEGTNQVELDVKTDAEEGKINLINRYYDMPGGAAYKGWINISKNVLKGTDQIDVDDTFYAGIFTKTEDGEYNLYKIVTLANNDTVKTEVTLGGEDGDQPITYYVYETDEQGNRIDQNEFAYTVTGEGEASLDKSNTTADITITNTLNEQYSLLIRKVDENKDALAGAKFEITDGNGNVTDTWTSTLKDHPMVLEPGTYKLSEIAAPDGYKPGGEVTITVDEEGGISIESEIDGEADFDEDEDGVLDYINYPDTTITPTATTTPSATTTPGGSQTTYRKGVKTGDDTPIALYILLLAAATCAAGGAAAAGRKKRKNK